MQTLELCIPNLIPDYAGHELLSLYPALAYLVGQAHASSATKDFEAYLKTHLGQEKLAIADYSAHCLEQSEDYIWLRADPVVFQADFSGLFVKQAVLDLSKQEVEELTTDLNQWLIPQGYLLIALTAHEWLLGSKAELAIATETLWSVLGRPLDAETHQGKSALALAKLSAELQLLLSQHPINQKRLEQGLACINGLWFWGQGISKEIKLQTDVVYGDAIWLQGLAKQQAIEFVDSFTTLLATQRARAMVILEALLYCTQVVTWQDCVSQLEEEIFKPLLQALADGDVKRVVLSSPASMRYEYKPSWWQRRQLRKNSML